jgi:hypothetical protein
MIAAQARGPETRDGHFRFGHDTRQAGRRASPRQRYWTEYGRCARTPDGMAAELARAVGEMTERFGRLSVACLGGPVARAVAACAERQGIEARLVTVALDGSSPPLPPAARLAVETVEIGFEAFADFALAFAATAGCGSPWSALAALVAARDTWPHVADHGTVTLVNHGVDMLRGAIAAPTNLALADAEHATGLDRMMAIDGRPGVAQPLRWSPELVGAQLTAPPMRDWIAGALAAGAGAEGVGAGGAGVRGAGAAGEATSRAAEIRAWRRCLPELGAQVPVVPWPDPGLRRRIEALGRRLRRLTPGCDAVHYFPLHRLAERLDLDLGAALGEGAALYGRVVPSHATDGVAA